MARKFAFGTNLVLHLVIGMRAVSEKHAHARTTLTRNAQARRGGRLVRLRSTRKRV